MSATPTLVDVPGLAWAPSGQSTLSGPLLALAQRLDRRLVAMARRWQAEDVAFPPTIAAADLARVDYFRSFPHLATFAACLDPTDANLAAFADADGEPVDEDGHVALTGLAPVHAVLTPAACYHLYAHHQGRTFERAVFFTTRATCFRRETHYVPLERQWSFTMREVVCLGPAGPVRSFLDAATAEVDALARELGLPVAWVTATDPFFRPSRHPQHLMQQVDPTKSELVFGERLALASTNLHHDHFGRAFAIACPPAPGAVAEPVHSACVAFGLERWLAAVVRHFGVDPGHWPEVGP